MTFGTVKWFNVASGFGMIAPDGGGADLFVHRTSMSDELHESVARGQRVAFNAREGGMGPEAIAVVALATADDRS